MFQKFLCRSEKKAKLTNPNLFLISFDVSKGIKLVMNDRFIFKLACTKMKWIALTSIARCYGKGIRLCEYLRENQKVRSPYIFLSTLVSMLAKGNAQTRDISVWCWMIFYSHPIIAGCFLRCIAENDTSHTNEVLKKRKSIRFS